MKTKKTTQDTSWEIKDRTYLVKGTNQPLTLKIPSRHTTKVPLLWFDSKTNEQKELRYATNQNSPFVDEQKGEVTLGHVIFEEGMLFVPKEKQNLQKLLSLYHPDLEKRLVTERLRSESRIIERLLSFGVTVPALYEVNIVNSEIIMEFIEGITLTGMKSR